ncbi:C40 family peptidase [Fodinicola feengrottensis]|uniref:C40 family peptidase n=1 Tax=Fodinicola feengrottensis TaxID=435914 RepID=UPI0031DD32C6
MRSHRRSLPRPLKNKWLTASLGVAAAGLMAVGVVAAPSVFAADQAKVMVWKYNTPSTTSPGSLVNLEGFIKTPEGQPIPNVTATLSRTEADGHYHALLSGTTNSQGVVTFQLYPGNSAYWILSYAGGTVSSGGGQPANPAPATTKAAPNKPAQNTPANPKPADSASPSTPAESSGTPSTDSGTNGNDANGNGSTSTNNGNGAAGDNQPAAYTQPVSNTKQVSNNADATPPAAPAGTSRTFASSVSPAVAVYVQDKGQMVVSTAAQYRGRPYQYGAAGPNSFDCSGFTKFIYAKFGKSLPHSATSQAGYGSSVSRSSMKPGDLMLFGRPGSYYHAAIYAGGGNMWDAPTSGQTVGSHRIWSNDYTVRRLVS